MLVLSTRTNISPGTATVLGKRGVQDKLVIPSSGVWSCSNARHGQVILQTIRWKTLLKKLLASSPRAIYVVDRGLHLGISDGPYTSAIRGTTIGNAFS